MTVPTLRRRAHARPPLYTKNPNGSDGMVQRQCTRDYKINPIERKIRDLLGLKPKQHWPETPCVEQWIGISTDEATRMKTSARAAITMRWPLIEQRMARRDCLAWLERYGFPIPPKSACTFCPFHSDLEWRRLKADDPKGWAEAVRVDESIRATGFKGLDGTLYLHRSLVPLAEVDLRTAEDMGQQNLFENECEGMCGV